MTKIMKQYPIISIKIGEETITFINGIIEFSDAETIEVCVTKCTGNLQALLEAGVPFDTIGDRAYKFQTEWVNLQGVSQLPGC